MTPAEREALGNTGPWLEVIFTRSGKDGSTTFYPACGGATYGKDQLEGVEKIQFIRLKDDVFEGLLKQFRDKIKEQKDLISSLELTLSNATAPDVLAALIALRSFMWSEGYADQTPAMAQADAAIAKAEAE